MTPRYVADHHMSVICPSQAVIALASVDLLYLTTLTVYGVCAGVSLKVIVFK